MTECDLGRHRPGTWDIILPGIQARRCTECGKVVETAPLPRSREVTESAKAILDAARAHLKTLTEFQKFGEKK